MDLWEHLLKLKVVEERVSPQGKKEYAVPGNILGNRTGITLRDSGNTYYSQEYYNDPSTQRHERIHQGQSELRELPAAPIKQIFRNLSPYYYSILDRIHGKNAELEQPAYNLRDSKNDLVVSGKMQEKMATEYLNHLKQQNAGDEGIVKIESALPEEILRAYITNSAPPIRMPIPAELKKKK